MTRLDPNTGIGIASCQRQERDDDGQATNHRGNRVGDEHHRKITNKSRNEAATENNNIMTIKTMKSVSLEQVPQDILGSDTVKLTVEPNFTWYDWEDELYEVRKWCDEHYEQYKVEALSRVVTTENTLKNAWKKSSSNSKAFPDYGGVLGYSPTVDKTDLLLAFSFATDDDAMLFKLTFC